MCQPSSPPVSFASEAIKLPLVTDLDIGLEDGERAGRAESVRQVLALIQRQEQPNAALLMGGDTEQDRCGLAYRAVALQRLAAYQEARIWPSSKWPSTAMTCRGNKLPMQWESPPLRTVGSSKDQ